MLSRRPPAPLLVLLLAAPALPAFAQLPVQVFASFGECMASKTPYTPAVNSRGAGAQGRRTTIAGLNPDFKNGTCVNSPELAKRGSKHAWIFLSGKHEIVESSGTYSMVLGGAKLTQIGPPTKSSDAAAFERWERLQEEQQLQRELDWEREKREREEREREEAQAFRTRTCKTSLGDCTAFGTRGSSCSCTLSFNGTFTSGNNWPPQQDEPARASYLTCQSGRYSCTVLSYDSVSPGSSCFCSSVTVDGTAE